MEDFILTTIVWLLVLSGMLFLCFLRLHYFYTELDKVIKKQDKMEQDIVPAEAAPSFDPPPDDWEPSY